MASCKIQERKEKARRSINCMFLGMNNYCGTGCGMNLTNIRHMEEDS